MTERDQAMTATEIARLNTVISKLTYMTHGHVGVDWRSGKRFVTYEKGDEFAAICEANEAMRYARTALEQSQAALVGVPALYGQYDDEGNPLWMDGAVRQLFALRARLEAATKALKPFAQEAECWSDRAPDDLSVSVHSIDAEHFGTPSRFTVGDLRRARAAIAEMEKGT